MPNEELRDEFLRVYVWEVLFGSIDPDIAQRRVNELLDQGAQLRGQNSMEHILEKKPGEIIVNEQGGAQSKLHGSPRLIPGEALLRLSGVVAEGADRYAENNWRRIPFEEHLSHALEHVFLYMNGQRDEDHIGHALCRLAFAVAMEPQDGFDFKQWRPLTTKKEDLRNSQTLNSCG